MLRIEHDLEDSGSPTKAWADATWRANPCLSPDWWREAQGQTLGKVGLDWRETVPENATLPQGMNVVLVSPHTWPQVAPEFSTHKAICPVLVTPDVENLPANAPSWRVWHTPAVTQAGLEALERQVKTGEAEAYGLVLQPHGLALDEALSLAAKAVEQVWGRKKRPALRLLVAQADLLDLSLFTHPSVTHKAEAVSPLELAARLGLAVILTPAALPHAAEPSLAALTALMQVAQAEQALNQHLGGWPQVGGQPLFSVLAALGQGRTPWPSPALWQGWLAHVWPGLSHHWHALVTPETQPLITDYLTYLETLQPHGIALSRTAAAPLVRQVLQSLAQALPQAWQGQTPQAHMLLLLSSLPGVAAVAVPQVEDAARQALQTQAGLPDVAAVLYGAKIG